jgi:hypothetical protein
MSKPAPQIEKTMALLAMMVDHVNMRAVIHFPSLADSPAQVYVFVIHKKASVEQARLLQGFLPEHHARGRYPVDLQWRIMIPIHHEVPSEPRGLWGQAV